MGDLVPFRAKAKSYVAPYDMLRDLARLDATLVYETREDGTFIGFKAPQGALAKFNAILSMLDRCGETWRFRYFATVFDVLAIEDPAELPVGTVKRLELRRAFVLNVPEDGAEAFRLLYAYNDQIRKLRRDRSGDDWLYAVNRRNDLLRTLESMKGTAFGQEVAAEAQRIADRLGINVQGVR